MPQVTSDAICVRHWDFSETSQTVSLFTRDLGMLRGLAKGSKRERSRFGGGIDLLTRGQVGALLKPGRELVTLTHWDLLETFRHLRERLEANRAAFYMAELVSLMISDAHPHPRSYDAFVGGLRGLADPTRREQELLEFQWILLDDCGYRPELFAPRDETIATESLAFSPRAGGLVRTGAEDVTWPVRRETIDVLRRLAHEIDARHAACSAATGRPAARAAEVAPEDAALEHGALLPTLPSPATFAPEIARRASRLLAAYAREVLGLEPVTMADVFGPIDVGTRAR